MIAMTAGAGAAVNVGPPEVISLVLSVLLACAALWKELSNRRKLKAEAGALDLKTPAEVDNLNATTHTAEFTRVLDFNKQVLETNKELTGANAVLRAGLDEMRAKFDQVLEGQRKQDEHASRLELWLEQAYTYIEDLLAWVDRHVPGAVPPVPPRNYRPRFTRDTTDAVNNGGSQ